MTANTARKLINYNSYKGVGRPTVEDYRNSNQLITVILYTGTLVGLFEYLVMFVK